MAMTPKQHKTHMEKMRAAKVAKRAEAAQAAIDADNPIELAPGTDDYADGVSVDDIAPAAVAARARSRRQAAIKKAEPIKRPVRRPRVAQPKAAYEPDPPRRPRHQLDPAMEAREARVGVVGGVPIAAQLS